MCLCVMSSNEELDIFSSTCSGAHDQDKYGSAQQYIHSLNALQQKILEVK